MSSFADIAGDIRIPDDTSDIRGIVKSIFDLLQRSETRQNTTSVLQQEAIQAGITAGYSDYTTRLSALDPTTDYIRSLSERGYISESYANSINAGIGNAAAFDIFNSPLGAAGFQSIISLINPGQAQLDQAAGLVAQQTLGNVGLGISSQFLQQSISSAVADPSQFGNLGAGDSAGLIRDFLLAGGNSGNLSQFSQNASDFQKTILYSSDPYAIEDAARDAAASNTRNLESALQPIVGVASSAQNFFGNDIDAVGAVGNVAAMMGMISMDGSVQYEEVAARAEEIKEQISKLDNIRALTGETAQNLVNFIMNTSEMLQGQGVSQMYASSISTGIAESSTNLYAGSSMLGMNIGFNEARMAVGEAVTSAIGTRGEALLSAVGYALDEGVAIDGITSDMGVTDIVQYISNNENTIDRALRRRGINAFDSTNRKAFESGAVRFFGDQGLTTGLAAGAIFDGELARILQNELTYDTSLAVEVGFLASNDNLLGMIETGTLNEAALRDAGVQEADVSRFMQAAASIKVKSGRNANLAFDNLRANDSMQMQAGSIYASQIGQGLVGESQANAVQLMEDIFQDDSDAVTFAIGLITGNGFTGKQQDLNRAMELMKDDKFINRLNNLDPDEQRQFLQTIGNTRAGGRMSIAQTSRLNTMTNLALKDGGEFNAENIEEIFDVIDGRGANMTKRQFDYYVHALEKIENSSSGMEYYKDAGKDLIVEAVMGLNDPFSERGVNAQLGELAIYASSSNNRKLKNLGNNIANKFQDGEFDANELSYLAKQIEEIGSGTFKTLKNNTVEFSQFSKGIDSASEALKLIEEKEAIQEKLAENSGQIATGIDKLIEALRSFQVNVSAGNVEGR